MASTITRDTHYATSEYKTVEVVFVGRANNARTAFYGSVCLPDDVSNGTFEWTDMIEWGSWYSDGASHTLDFSGVTNPASMVNTDNIVWFFIPATNISSASTICWLRLHFSYRVT